MTLHHAMHLLGWCSIATFWIAGAYALWIVAPGLIRGARIVAGRLFPNTSHPPVFGESVRVAEQEA